MRASIRSTAVVFVQLAVFVCAGIAHADAPGDKLLASVDAASNAAKTLYFEYDVLSQEPGKAERKSAMLTRRKGEKALLEFTAPADLKGTKLLTLSSDQMYVYLPAFGKVRRIASHTTDQGFMGMTFSVDDLYGTRYSDRYTATLASDGPKEWKLTLVPRAGQTPSYSKIEMTVAKDHKLPTELRYFDAKSALAKTETRTGYTCEGAVCAPSERKMIDHGKGGAWTKLLRKKWKVDESIADDLFSKKNLEK